MRATPPAPKDIDEYIAGFPSEVGEALQNIRLTVREAAPQAEETISYKMPTFTLNGDSLVYFAAYKNHIGFYPAPTGVPEFKEALAKYGAGRGTLQFPLDQPMPLDLIGRVVKFRMRESLAKATARGKNQS